MPGRNIFHLFDIKGIIVYDQMSLLEAAKENTYRFFIGEF